MPEYLPRRRRVGGLRIDPRKAAATRDSIAPAFIPTRLAIPVEALFGSGPEICVTPGQHVLRGEPLAAAAAGSGIADVHASSSGTVVEITKLDYADAHGNQSVPAIVIETDGLDTPYPAAPPSTPSARPTTPAERAEQIEFIRRSGIVGLGGAAVSTSWKLTLAQSAPTLIINGAECEPYISCDDMLMRERAADVLAGSQRLCELIGAQLCIVAIERDKPEAIDAMRRALESCNDARLHLAELPSIYPAGGERQLVELLIGREVPSGAFPADIGVLCQNVGTAYAVEQALSNGEPLISRVVTLAGTGLRRQCNVNARIGTPLAELIEHFGGYADDAAALIVGGSMMGIAQASDSVVVTRGTNCILVPDGAEFGELPRTEWPCIRCGECAGACPARLLPQELLRAAQRADFTQLDSLGLDDCIECGCCDAICPSHIALTRRFVDARSELKRRRRDKEFAAVAQTRFDTRTRRIVAIEDRANSDQAELRAQVATPEDGRQAIHAALERARRRQTAENSDDESQ